MIGSFTSQTLFSRVVSLAKSLIYRKAYMLLSQDSIDDLRRERLVFDGVYRKLEVELADKKSEMTKIVEVSNAAYEARERAQQEIDALRGQAKQEQEDFEVYRPRECLP